MANVYINGNRIVPAPLYSISHEINRAAGGDILSCVYTISLEGTILPDRGYPTSTGGLSSSAAYDLDVVETGVITEQDRFKSLLNKQSAIKELALLEGTGYGSNKTVSIINSVGGLNGQTDDKIEFTYFSSNVEFQSSPLVTKSDYTISFSANDVKLNGRSINPSSGAYQDYNLRSATDSLNIERIDDSDNTVRITRSVKAQSYKSYNSDVSGTISATKGWEFAKEWVKSQFPSDPRASPTAALHGAPILSLPTGYGYVGASLAEDLDKLSAEYGLTVTWTYAPLNASGQYYAADDYSISRTTNKLGNKVSYRVSGNIKGLKDNTGKASAYDVAKIYFSETINGTNALKNRIASSFDVPASNILGPTTETSSHNKFGGTISYEYDFYKQYSELPECFYDFDVSVNRNEDERVVAEIAVPGRALGPVIQDINTKQTTKRSVSANFTVSESAMSLGYASVQGLKSSGITFLEGLEAIPTGTQNTNFWQTGFSHNLDLSSGRYSMSINYLEK